MKGRNLSKRIKTIEGDFTFKKEKYYLQKQYRKNSKYPGYYYVINRETKETEYRFDVYSTVKITKEKYTINTKKKVEKIKVQKRKQYNQNLKELNEYERRRFVEIRRELIEHSKKNYILKQPRKYFFYISMLGKYEIPFLGYNIKVKDPNLYIKFSIRKV